MLCDTDLEEGQEIVKFLASSPSIEEHPASFQHSRDETNAEEIVGRVEGIEAARYWSTS